MTFSALTMLHGHTKLLDKTATKMVYASNLVAITICCIVASFAVYLLVYHLKLISVGLKTIDEVHGKQVDS